ncbi:MAG: hypothetical protein OXG35_26450 [Acidobacteria bacterium]|nr:hypothetical protein [Acidobacteriota bacterium]
MLYDIVLIVLGLGLVAKGGDLFVDSSIYIGQALRIPRFVIGGTLVSLATTTPELVVSAMASSVGDTGIALGNAVGSCICNIGLIVGTVSLLTPVEVEKRDFVRRAAWMVSAGCSSSSSPGKSGPLSRPPSSRGSAWPLRSRYPRLGLPQHPPGGAAGERGGPEPETSRACRGRSACSCLRAALHRRRKPVPSSTRQVRWPRPLGVPPVINRAVVVAHPCTPRCPSS